MLRKVLRITLVIYLLHSGLVAMPFEPADSMIPHGHRLLLAAIALTCLVTAGILIFSPRIGRWGVLICQAPQFVVFVIPSACFYLLIGVHLSVSLGYFPDAGGLKPHMHFSDGAQWCIAFGRAETLREYAIGMNLSAIAAVMGAFFVAKKPNKALEPTTTSVTSPAAQEPRQP